MGSVEGIPIGVGIDDAGDVAAAVVVVVQMGGEECRFVAGDAVIFTNPVVVAGESLLLAHRVSSSTGTGPALGHLRFQPVTGRRTRLLLPS